MDEARCSQKAERAREEGENPALYRFGASGNRIRNLAYHALKVGAQGGHRPPAYLLYHKEGRDNMDKLMVMAVVNIVLQVAVIVVLLTK